MATAPSRLAGYIAPPICFWWHLDFPDEVLKMTKLFLPNNQTKTFVSINCLKYFTVIFNYCAALMVLIEEPITGDPHPVLVNVTNN